MTIYTTYYAVESPLNQELQPLIRIRRRDLIEPHDRVRGRMVVLLGFALSLIVLFVLFVSAPRDVGEASASDAADSGSRSAQSDSEFVAAGSLSPIFSVEVQRWRPQILRWSAEHGFDPNIVATIMQIESCGDPAAVSSAGAQGLFQVMPFHFAAGEDMLDPDTNAKRGLTYFRQQLEETGGNIYLSFAGYNGGSAASSAGWDSWVDETKRYYVWSKGIYEEATSGAEASNTLARWMEAGGASLCEQASLRLGLQ